MPVTVGELTSEVVSPPEPPEGPRSSELSVWEEVERVRAAQQRLLQDRLRIRAEEFDD